MDVEDTYPLWEVREGDARVVLFGHHGAQNDPWRSARIEHALELSGAFWMETPEGGPDDEATIRARCIDRTRPLVTWLTDAEQRRVKDAAAFAEVAEQRLAPCPPWLAASLLSSGYWGRQDPLPDPAPVLLAKVKSAQLPVSLEFPTFEGLLDYWMGCSKDAQVQWLMYTIDDLVESARATFMERAAIWAAGDLATETERVLDWIANYPDAYEELSARRNRAWPARFREMLDRGGSTFVLVGAAHLVGPESIQVHLAADGMQARRI